MCVGQGGDVCVCVCACMGGALMLTLNVEAQCVNAVIIHYSLGSKAISFTS